MLAALQPLLTLKKAAKTFNFQSNELPPKFLRLPLFNKAAQEKKYIQGFWLFTRGNSKALTLVLCLEMSSASFYFYFVVFIWF